MTDPYNGLPLFEHSEAEVRLQQQTHRAVMAEHQGWQLRRELSKAARTLLSRTPSVTLPSLACLERDSWERSVYQERFRLVHEDNARLRAMLQDAVDLHSAGEDPFPDKGMVLDALREAYRPFE